MSGTKPRTALKDDPQALSLDALRPLPQVASLRRVAAALWAEEDVVAVWLGGSFACGAADEHSDVDLRVAVRPQARAGWREPDLARIFGGEVVGSLSFPLGDALLHHLVLAGGDIYDLWTQSAEQPPSPEEVLVLGCRDGAFAQKLAAIGPPPASEPAPADPNAVREVVNSFWINTHKHRKVLFRRLDLVAQKGVGMERDVLQRLWYIRATGKDVGGRGPTIHSLTETDRVIMETQGRRALALTGAPLTTRDEIIQAIEANQDEVAAVGRHLATTLGFEYPTTLERTVREAWRRFRASAVGDQE